MQAEKKQKPVFNIIISHLFKTSAVSSQRRRIIDDQTINSQRLAFPLFPLLPFPIIPNELYNLNEY